jgi:heme exporter protein D
MAEFLHMGGYASYVWSSYGIAFIVLLPLLLLPIREKKRLIKKLKGKYKREQAELQQSSENQVETVQEEIKQSKQKDTE